MPPASPPPTPEPGASTSALGATAFVPLRLEPPPQLVATWWLRYLLLVAQLVGITVVLLTEYQQGGQLLGSWTVVTPYVLAAVMLVCWSALAMLDARRLVPAKPYTRASNPLVVVVLWLLAFAAPVGAFRVIGWARDHFADNPDDLGVAVITAGAVLGSFLLVWLPFRYHVMQAHRIGAPGRVVAAWFWLPLVAMVGVLAVNSLGLSDLLGEDGFTDLERMVQIAVVFGAPALVFALATWRATTVFDEVIDLRWRRWRNEWAQTLAAMAAQPAPQPEAPVR